MDPNSGKIYRDLSEQEIKRRGLVPVSEEVAEMVEVGRQVIQRRNSQSKDLRRAKNKASRKARRVGR